MQRKEIFKLLLSVVILSSSYSISGTSYAANLDNPFALENLSDVKRNHWSYSALERIVEELQIMPPKTSSMFMGNEISNRYEVAEAFFNAAKKLEIISGLDLKIQDNRKRVELVDVEDSKKDLIEDVVNVYGLMQSLPGSKFSGLKKISRYEVAYELDNYLTRLEKVVAKANRPAVNRLEKLVDVAPGHWATNAIKNMVNKYQIMKGYPDNQFKGNKLPALELGQFR